ncbi:MAG: heavy-metal-associated domain-containing protein [Lachnospiraceae bacterium]|nr:heavy-metal-associated domain-containing protein [Lachnospiraceae bacterium]
MENIVIIGVLVIVVIIGVIYTVKHFKGESSCCGGGSSVKVKKKKLKNVIARKTIIIEGMTCDHCKNRVERVLNEMEGVAGKVNLSKKQAIASMEKEVSDDALRAVIEKAGYKVVEIR